MDQGTECEIEVTMSSCDVSLMCGVRCAGIALKKECAADETVLKPRKPKDQINLASVLYIARIPVMRCQDLTVEIRSYPSHSKDGRKLVNVLVCNCSGVVGLIGAIYYIWPGRRLNSRDPVVKGFKEIRGQLS